MEEESYTSTHPLGHTGPVAGSLYLLITWMKRNGIVKNGVKGYRNKYDLLGITVGVAVCNNYACCILYNNNNNNNNNNIY